MLIQQDNFIQRLLALEKGKPHIPNVRKKRAFFLNKLTDARLVKYIRCGNNHAFEILIKRHELKLKQIIRNSLFDKSMVEDVLQDVWELAIPQIRGTAYKEDGNFYGWLSTIAFRKAMKTNRRKFYSPETVEYSPVIHDEHYYSEENDTGHEILKEAKRIISTLDERDQEIMRMHYDEKLTLEAIARKMNLNRKSVEKRHLRLIDKLRKGLKTSAAFA